MKSVKSQVIDIVVVGAGAAGLTAAIFAKKEANSVLLLERNDEAGKKILMSGGTRCNLLPVSYELDDFFTDSEPKALKKILKSWYVKGCLDWFQAMGLELSCEEKSNKWFPKSNSAREVRDKLLAEAQRNNVEIIYRCSLEDLHRKSDLWELKTRGNELIHARKVIIATGGLSIPSLGTDGTGHNILSGLGHSSTVYPALTPLFGTMPGNERLAGLSLEASIKVEAKTGEIGTSKRPGFLFTHKGFSGPSVLDVSHFAIRHTDAVKLKAKFAEIGAEDLDQYGKLSVRQLLKRVLPVRLAEALASEFGYPETNIAELNRKRRKELLQLLTEYPLNVQGHAGYKKAEVTGGGIPLAEINAKTLESAVLPDLYLCGEILDVFGRIGGFNFYWAWASGRLAGSSAAADLMK